LVAQQAPGVLSIEGDGSLSRGFRVGSVGSVTGPIITSTILGSETLTGLKAVVTVSIWERPTGSIAVSTRALQYESVKYAESTPRIS